MGRGRQKAKNTKVARELKYFSPATDFTSLEAELAPKDDPETVYEDKWADLYEDEDGDSEVAPSDDERSAEQDEQ